jgi:predicted DCC family thiol-disulfide oxidoreductase YuxK
MDTSDGNIIIVFDGYCILCDNFVKWIAKKDKDYKIHFTTFESNYINNNLFKKSEAVILCLKTIKCSKILISVFEIIPKTILDIGYSLVAYFRYKIFGKKKICSLPNTIISERILS